MSEMKTYTGGCHCGKVRYEVTMELAGVISCNCSICSKKAALMAFAPASQFKLLSDEEALATYQFNKRVIDHLFCKHCGISSFARGTRPDGINMVSINVRCLEGVVAGALPVKHFDGKSL
jgi:hypothetical protein